MTRPFYWSVRRELWENRALYIAPLAVAGVLLFGFTVSAVTLPHRMRALQTLDPMRQRAAVMMPYNFIAGLTIMTAFVVGVFYCLDALHGERRDRSILFWKSLPVSDRTTVLAKASMPLLFLPLFIFPVIATALLIVLIVNTAALSGSEEAFAMMWRHMKFGQYMVAVLYGLTTMFAWHAPIYAWFLLVSSWAKRAAVLWAILPLLAISAFERVAFNSMHFMNMLGFRMTGWYRRGYMFPPKGTKVPLDPLEHLTPAVYLSSPSLWIGLLLAAAFLATAIRLRRYRDPI